MADLSAMLGAKGVTVGRMEAMKAVDIIMHDDAGGLNAALTDSRPGRRAMSMTVSGVSEVKIGHV